MVGAAVPASLSEAGDGWDRNLPAGVGSGGRRTPVGLAAATVVAPCRALSVGAASILLCFFLQGKASLTSALRCSPTRGKKDETEHSQPLEKECHSRPLSGSRHVGPATETISE